MSSAIQGLRTPEASQSLRPATRSSGWSSYGGLVLRIGRDPFNACLLFAAQQRRCVGPMEGAK
jgi:hypothetical protein